MRPAARGLRPRRAGRAYEGRAVAIDDLRADRATLRSSPRCGRCERSRRQSDNEGRVAPASVARASIGRRCEAVCRDGRQSHLGRVRRSGAPRDGSERRAARIAPQRAERRDSIAATSPGAVTLPPRAPCRARCSFSARTWACRARSSAVLTLSLPRLQSGSTRAGGAPRARRGGGPRLTPRRRTARAPAGRRTGVAGAARGARSGGARPRRGGWRDHGRGHLTREARWYAPLRH